MSSLRSVTTAMILFAVTSTAGAQTHHVDPVNGVDATGNGGATNPFRSITFALTQQTNPSIHLKLRKGTYSAATGESFPIGLSGDVTLEGTGPGWSSQATCGARLSYPQNPVLTAAIEVLGGSVTLQRFCIDTGHRGVWVRGFDDLVCEDLDITGFRAIDVDRSAAAVGVARLQRCRLRATVSTLSAAALKVRWGSGTLEPPMSIDVLQCDISGGNLGTRAVDLTGSPGGFILRLESSVLHASQAGVYAASNVTVQVNHCTIWGNGTGQPGEGGLVNGGPTVTFLGDNNLFNANGGFQDVSPVGPFGSMGRNLMQQPGGGGTANPAFGPAYLSNPAAGDFHLLPAPSNNPTPNAAINGAIPIPLMLDQDIDGGDRPEMGAVDFGADEYEPHWISVNPRFHINQSSTVSIIGDGGTAEAYMLFVGTAPNASVPYPGGPLLANPMILTSGNIPMSHRATYSSTLPNDSSLIGAQLVLQALYLDTTTSTWSYSNVLAAPVCQ